MPGGEVGSHQFHALQELEGAEARGALQQLPRRPALQTSGLVKDKGGAFCQAVGRGACYPPGKFTEHVLCTLLIDLLDLRVLEGVKAAYCVPLVHGEKCSCLLIICRRLSASRVPQRGNGSP